MKFVLVTITLMLTGCGAKPPKTCYELRLELSCVDSKQTLCTNKPLKESYSFRKLDQ